MEKEPHSRQAFEASEQQLDEVNASISGDKSVDELLDLVSSKEAQEKHREDLLDDAHGKAMTEDERREKLSGEFRELTKNIDLLAVTSEWETSIPGLNSILIHKPKDGETDAKLTLYYQGRTRQGQDEERHVTIPLAMPGYELSELLPTQMDRVPAALRDISYNTIVLEVLDNLKAYNLDRILEPNFSAILPPGEYEAPEPTDNEEPSRKHERAKIDRSRLAFFTRQPSLVGIIRPKDLCRISYGKGYGPGKIIGKFSDYHAFVFPAGVMFENAVRENNIFFRRFNEPLTAEQVDSINHKTMTPEEQAMLFDSNGLTEAVGMTKQELRAEHGQFRNQHPAVDWPAELRQKWYDELQWFIDNGLQEPAEEKPHAQ